MTPNRETRAEFCARKQEDWQAFAARYMESHGGGRFPTYYPPEGIAPTVDLMHGWRISIYAGNGRVARVFPFHARVGRSPEDDHRTFPLTTSWEPGCDHVCWPQPRPDCGCGVWASATPQDAASIARGARDEPLAYPVELQDVRRVRPLVGCLELIGRSARITGPVLTTSRAAAADLERRGFSTTVVGDLAAHLEAMSQEGVA